MDGEECLLQRKMLSQNNTLRVLRHGLFAPAELLDVHLKNQ